ncbi:conjugal transfer protein TraG [Vibrio tasmaniensis ZS-17]|uniref:virB8 family protein n=1 Tax=Vibrio tasmaniensis TaxID=212663 RepID=UPI0002FEC1FD|nr:type IV secretion system protein [Vibrio tasmaniensis]OED65899.1 conjugal transfer protein TraG [Vibrio tasmaniensis ZS-17]
MENTLDIALEENQSKAQSRPSKADSKPVDAFLNQIKSFEEDRVSLAKQSAKTAWKVAAGFGVLAMLSVVAIVVMMPLKQIEPYLLKVDNTTGYTNVVRPLTDAKGVSYGEVLDKYWLNQFVIERNSYEWETIQNSFNTVKLMSGRQVFGAYSNYIKGDSSPTKLFSDKRVIRITVEGITFLPATSKEQTLAQVRFTRYIENSEGEAALGYEPTQWTATITFDYQSSIKTEDERRLNPLGFQVTSYREDRNL